MDGTSSKLEQYRGLKAEAQALLNDVGSALVSLLDAPAEEQGHQNIDTAIHGFFNAYYDLRTRHEADALTVAVLALTKSGKSTLINSFLGDELLPVNNVPETARIARVTHAPAAACPQPLLEFTAPPASRSSSLSSAASLDAPGSSHGSGSSSSGGGSPPASAKVVVAGAAAIREQLQQLNRDVRAREHLRNDEQVLEITAPLVVLESTAAAANTSSDASSSDGAADIKLSLLDTPGPNEAGEEGLKHQVERLLGRVDAVIYLLDYTKLKTAEEAALLGRLATLNPALVSRLASRLFFAVNKADQAGEGSGLGEEETREYVAEMVTRQLGCPGFKLHPDQVLLLSARNALLARLVLAGRADSAAVARFSRIAFGSFCNPRGSSGGGGSSGGAARSPALMAAAAEDMLEASGLPQLEDRVLGFLAEAAAGVKLVATLDDVGRLLTQVSNVAASCRAALAASSSRLAASTAALQIELGETLAEFDGLMEGTQELQVEVADELRAHLGNLRIRLFQFISDALDPAALQQRQAAAADAAAAAAAAAAEEPGSSRRHRRHRHGCCHSRHSHRRQHHRHSSSHASNGGDAAACAPAAAAAAFPMDAGSSDCDCSGDDGEPAAAAAAGASSGSSSSSRGWWNVRRRFLSLFGGPAAAGGVESKDELSSALMDLSEELMAQIQADVTEAWAVMEAATNARAGRLVVSLNTAIAGLSARLEGAVNEALEIRLQPVSLALAAPDAVSFHADLSELIASGIGQQQQRHIRSAERTDIVWEARRGVCRLTQFYVQVPRRRRVIETYTATTYSLLPAAVADHFMGVVDEAISTTEAQLAGYVRAYVARQVEAARQAVRQYGDRYIESLSAALETASQGADARCSALAAVETYCSSLEALRGRVAALQGRAEALVPHDSGAGCGAFEQLEFEGEEEEEEEEEEEQQELQELQQEELQQEELQQEELQQEEGQQQQEQKEEVEEDPSRQEEEQSSAGGDVAAAAEAEAAAAASDAAGEEQEEAAGAAAPAALVAGSGGGMARTGSSVSSGSVSSGLLVTADDVAEARQAAAAAAGGVAALQMMRLPQPEPESNPGSGTTDLAAAPAAAGGPEQEAVAPAASGLMPLLSEADIAGGIAPAAPAAALLTADDVCGGLPVVSAAAVAAGGGSCSASSQQGPAAEAAAASGGADGDAGSSSVPGALLQEEAVAGARALPLCQAAAAGDDGSNNSGSEEDDCPERELLSACQDPCGPVSPHSAAPVAVAPAPPQPLLPPVAAAGGAGSGVDADNSDGDEPPSLLDAPAPESAGLLLPRLATHLNAPAAAAAGSSGASAGGSLTPVSAVSCLGSPVLSVGSGAGTDCTGFSGMTAGTEFTLGSSGTMGSGFSRAQEALANSVLAAGPRTAVPAAAGLAGSGLLLPRDGGAGGGSSSVLVVPCVPPALPAAAAAGAGSSGSVYGSGSAAAGGLDTSLYASIVAHSEDAEQGRQGSGSGGAGSGSGSGSGSIHAGSPFSNESFRQSFAAALTAAGLDGLAGQSVPPSGSPTETGSEDWQLVEPEEGAGAAAAGKPDGGK